jgi:outer membrane protein assembly factor BamD (BamD/ComL family)
MSAGHQTADAKTMRPTLGVIATILIAIAALTAPRFVSREDAASGVGKDSAGRFYLDGSRLLKEGKTEQAVDLLHRAHALVRENPDYELELINALMAAGETDEAEP